MDWQPPVEQCGGKDWWRAGSQLMQQAQRLGVEEVQMVEPVELGEVRRLVFRFRQVVFVRVSGNTGFSILQREDWKQEWARGHCLQMVPEQQCLLEARRLSQ